MRAEQTATEKAIEAADARAERERYYATRRAAAERAERIVASFGKDEATAAESVALTLKNNYDNMCNEMNHFAKHVIITGGGSNSDLFMQIFADVFNLPARRNAINGCASLGAAINTAVGLGLYPDYATAVDNMVRVKDIFIPIESNAKRYDAMNKGIFKDLTKHTDVILKKSYEVMHGELGNVDSIQSWSNA